VTERVLFGAAYYHEYQPYDRLETDLDLMAEAGFSVIRVGESVWSTWEPRDGVFNLEWLRPVLDGALRRGIHVVLGTPTYAVPPWLQRSHPEIAAERRTGQAVPWGARQEVDYGQPAFRYNAERVVRRVVGHYADHEAVIGYQIDNEPGLLLPHNDSTFQEFVESLRNTYGDVETLNEAWGLTYWSHRLSQWDDLWRPDGNTTPSYDLAWRRFQARRTTEFIEWQADIVRSLRRPGQFVTTCIAYGRPGIEDVELSRGLDVTAGNLYYHAQDGLSLPATPARYETSWFGQSLAELYYAADRIYASRDEPFLVTETGATSIGTSQLNHPPYDGQLRQAAWALVSRGARMIEYWHWHTIHHGAETYWGGVLGHGLQPGRTYAEVARIGAELARAGDLVTNLRPQVDVAIVFSSESNWAMQSQPPLSRPGGVPDKDSYGRILRAYYSGLFDAGAQPGVVATEHLGDDPVALVRRYPVLVVPALYVADDAVLDLLDAYARAGGHLVLGIRTGYADPEARARAEVAPGRLRAAAGVHYLEYSNLVDPLPVQGTELLEVEDGAHGAAWVDGLVVDDATAIAFYEHPHFGRWPAVTSKSYGDGRVTYVGTMPDAALARSLARFLVPDLPDRPDPVTTTSAVNQDGVRLWFVHNWSWEPAEVVAPDDLIDVLDGKPVKAGDPIGLGPWDVRVLAFD